jgi:hypothetical protein
MPATASRTTEKAICVVANNRRRRFVPGVIRTLPLARPRPDGACGEGKRGTKASSTAAAMARLVPTHSTLESSVTSSARMEKRAV